MPDYYKPYKEEEKKFFLLLLNKETCSTHMDDNVAYVTYDVGDNLKKREN